MAFFNRIEIVARPLNDQGQPKKEHMQAMPLLVLKLVGNEEQKSAKLIDTEGDQVVQNGPS